MNKASCPISADLVNAKLTRIYSISTFTAICIFLFTPFKEIIFFSAIDFVIRIFFGVKYSPICSLIKFILRIGNFQSHMVNAGPKRFAAKIGLFITSIMSISIIIGMTNTSLILGGISFIAVGAEAIFGYCVACKIYTYLPSILK